MWEVGLGYSRQAVGSAVTRRPGSLALGFALPRGSTWLTVGSFFALVVFDRLLLLRCGDVERNPGPILLGVQWNVHGLSQEKKIPLSKLLEDDLIAWCVLLETHFAATECDSFKLPGFNHFGLARPAGGQHGGGVSILVRDGIGLIAGKRVRAPGMELVTLTLVAPDSSQLLIVAAYFPKGAGINPFVLSEISAVLPPAGAVVVCMDANCHDPLWDVHSRSDPPGVRLAQWSVGVDLECVNSGEPTWRKTVSATPSSAPDVTFVRDCELRDWTPVFTPDSDHAKITMDVMLGSTTDRPITFKQSRRLYSWKKANWEVFRRFTRVELRKRNRQYNADEKLYSRWNIRPYITHRHTDDELPPSAEADSQHRREALAARRRLTVHALAGDLAHIVRHGVQRSVPCAVAKHPPFWTPELTKLDAAIDACRDPRKLEALVDHRRRRLREIATLRWRDTCNHLDTTAKASWHLIKSVYAPRPISCPVMVINDTPLSAQAQADELIAMYAKKSTRHVDAHEVIWSRKPTTPFQLFSLGELKKALREMHLGSAPGPDHLHCEALRMLPEVGLRLQLRLYNMTVARSQVPTLWKTGVIIPLLKDGKPPEDPASFRPVTLTSNLCKIVERMIARRIRTTVESRMCPQQAGFRPQRSTLDPLTHLMSRILARNQKEKVGVVLIDYARAFDSVDHASIIDTLRCYRVDPWLTRWTADFLQDRVARVKVHNTLSRSARFTCGVPQGSVLGPLLFIITMNTLSERLKAIPGLERAFFADDLTIMASGTENRNIEKTLQTALDCVEAWARSHFMELSVPKTHYTLFGTSHYDQLHLTINGVAITVLTVPKCTRTEMLSGYTTAPSMVTDLDSSCPPPQQPLSLTLYRIGRRLPWRRCLRQYRVSLGRTLSSPSGATCVPPSSARTRGSTITYSSTMWGIPPGSPMWMVCHGSEKYLSRDCNVPSARPPSPASPLDRK